MKKPTRGRKTKKQHKIDLPFTWPSDVSSTVYIAYLADFDRMEAEGYKPPNDFHFFYLDLTSGEILRICQDISWGVGYRSPWPEQSFQVIGQGWWYGYNVEIPKEFFNAPNPAVKELLGRENFNMIVDSVFEYCSKNNVENLNIPDELEIMLEVHQKYTGDTYMDIVNWNEY